MEYHTKEEQTQLKDAFEDTVTGIVYDAKSPRSYKPKLYLKHKRRAQQ